MADLKALILIGGFGARLRPLTCTKPKALFPILNKPLLQWTYENLAKNGVEEIILAVNKLTEFYINQAEIPSYGLKIKFSNDTPNIPLGTGGPIKKAEKLLGSKESFLVLNGDLFTDICYEKICQAHNEDRSVATIALHEVEDPSRYGVVELADNNRIIRFIEKPPQGKAPTNLINAGVYVLSPKIFEYIGTGPVSLEREVFPKLSADGVFYGHKVNGLWIDIGRPKEYLETNKRLLDIGYHDQMFMKEEIEVRTPVALESSAAIEQDSVIGPYAIIGKNVTIGKKVQIKNSVIFSNTIIKDGSIIDGAIIGEYVQIGSNVRISEGSIIADQAKIGDNICFNEAKSICPGACMTWT